MKAPSRKHPCTSVELKCVRQKRELGLYDGVTYSVESAIIKNGYILPASWPATLEPGLSAEERPTRLANAGRNPIKPLEISPPPLRPPTVHSFASTPWPSPHLESPRRIRLPGKWAWTTVPARSSSDAKSAAAAMCSAPAFACSVGVNMCEVITSERRNTIAAPWSARAPRPLLASPSDLQLPSGTKSDAYASAASLQLIQPGSASERDPL